jgi:cyclic lactone autoinducer peptide
MKKGNSILKKPLRIICNFLILLAPLVIVETASLFIWGEPECPDSLKELISNK